MFQNHHTHPYRSAADEWAVCTALLVVEQQVTPSPAIGRRGVIRGIPHMFCRYVGMSEPRGRLQRRDAGHTICDDGHVSCGPDHTMRDRDRRRCGVGPHDATLELGRCVSVRLGRDEGAGALGRGKNFVSRHCGRKNIQYTFACVAFVRGWTTT